MRLIFLILLFIPLACTPLQNRTDQIGIECGLKKQLVGNRTYIKLINPNGDSYDASDVRALKASLKNLESDSQSLAITPNACVIVEGDGTIQAIDSRNGDFATIQVAKKESAILQSVRMMPKQDLKASLACNEDGLFASKTLTQPILINFSDDAAGINLRLDVYNSANTFTTTLYRKTIGDAQLKLAETLPVQNLPEGIYQLKLYGNHISEGLDSPTRLLNPEQACRLTILRGLVKLDGFDLSHSIYAPDTQLPWTGNSPYESLAYCKENRHEPAGDLREGNECRPRGYCQDMGHFQKANAVKTDKPGVYDYFVFSENRIGEKSALSCQTIIVSEKAPEIKISWKHDDLQKEGSVLRKPYAIIKAHIDTRHDLLDAATLAGNLSCKVDFEIKGKSSFADKSVMCLEGKCKGTSLAEYTPCDPDFSFSLVEALNNPGIGFSRLRLTVKATDGAGHAVETENSFFLNQSTWIRENLEFKVNDVAQDLVTYEIDPSGSPIAIFRESGKQQTVAVFQEKQWAVLDQEAGSGFDYTLTRNWDQSIQIAKIGHYSDGVEVQIFSYASGKLVEKFVSKPENRISSCQAVLQGPHDEIWCTGTEIREVYQVKDGRFQRLPPALDANDPDVGNFMFWRVLADGRIAGYNRSDIFVWENEQWSRMKLERLPGDTDIYTYDLVEDFKGRLWVNVTDQEHTGSGLYRIENGKLIQYASPSPQKTVGLASHPANGPGLKNLAVGALKFDFSSDSWTSIGYPIADLGFLPGLMATHGSGTDTIFVNVNNQGIFETGSELMYWPLTMLGLLPLNGQKIARAKENLYFVDGTRRAGSLMRMRRSPTSSFDSRMLDMRDSTWNGVWQDDQGHNVISFSNGSILTSYPDHVTTELAPASWAGAGFITKMPNQKFCIFKYSGIYIYDQMTKESQKIAEDGYGKSQAGSCSGDKKGRVWWVHHTDINVWDGSNVQNVEGIRPSTEEVLFNMQATPDNDLRVVYSSLRLMSVDINLSIRHVFNAQDFSTDSTTPQIESIGSIGARKILVQVINSRKQRSYFTVDLESNEIHEDTALKAILGNSGFYQIKTAGTTVYVMSPSFQASILKLNQGVWQIIATLEDFRTIIGSKDIPPTWMLPEESGYIWIITRSPQSLGRFDPRL